MREGIVRSSGEIRKRRGVRSKVVKTAGGISTLFSQNSSDPQNFANKVSPINKDRTRSFSPNSISSNYFNVINSYLSKIYDENVSVDISLFIFDAAEFYNKSPLQVFNEYKKFLYDGDNGRQYDVLLGLENIISGSETQKRQMKIPKPNKRVLI